MGFFGDVWSSMLSLYMAMSGGKDWSTFWVVLEPIGVMYRFIFLFCITLAIFAAVNVVTAVFVESALQTSGNDKDTLIREAITNRTRYLEAIEEVFKEMDESGDGIITVDEFEAHVKDERVLAYFDILKLDVSDERRAHALQPPGRRRLRIARDLRVLPRMRQAQGRVPRIGARPHPQGAG